MAKLHRGLVLVSLALAGLTLSAPRALAQAPALDVVTFEDAVQRAIQSNLTVERASTAVLGAEALLAQARAALRPTAGGS
ncbi:MAG: hypothetical protein IT181_00455, partial [Acidobacteria bacterium]|nr:hypothetical protein [Acidobacteriota bacterium]